MDLLVPYHKGYTESMIYENAIEDLSPIDRIRFIFKGNTLVAIIHSRDLGVDFLHSVDLVRNLKIIIMEEMSDADKKNFIQMNIDSYSGVD